MAVVGVARRGLDAPAILDLRNGFLVSFLVPPAAI